MDRAGTITRGSGIVRVAVLAAAVIVTLATVGAASGGLSGTAAPTPQIPGSPAAPTAADVSPMCTTTDPAAVLGPSTSLPSTTTSTVVTPSGGVVTFVATSSDLYVNTGTQLATYTLAGSEVGSFALPYGFTSSEEPTAPVIDSSGNIYIASNWGQVVDKYSPTGTLDWSVDPESGSPTGLFSVTNGGTFELMVSVSQDTAHSDVLNTATGAVTGTFPLVDSGYVTQAPGGDLLYSANGYVTTFSPTGTVLSRFGDSQTEQNGAHTGGGVEFADGGQALQATSGGTIYTVDPNHTIEATSPQGFFQASTSFNSTLAVGSGYASLIGSTVYFVGGPTFNTPADDISSVPLATLQAYLGAIQAPDDSLGWGAGLATPATGNYFAPGTTPSLEATFDPWWTSVASGLQLSYSVENVASLDAYSVPAPTVVTLPTTAAGLASVPLALPSADTVAGPYQVQASLIDTATNPPTTLGTTCMPYTVGATGDGLDFATLPAGVDTGGPADPRGVALAAQLGLSGLRSQSVINWGTFLPNCNSSSPTAATCGPSAMTFASASTDPYRAAYLADQDGVAYWIQVSGGDATSMALVTSGLWQADVASLVSHYATVPAGCGACAPVTKWEPWNESNNTGWGNAAAYTTQVLAPFYAAVKSVLPGTSSTVIGGTTIEPSIGWWQQLVAAGGLADMDVAAIHPYTGSNDAYEEDGIPAQVRQLEAVLGTKPLWFTEIGWWSDGDYNFLGQANGVSRSLIWQKALGVPVQNYFFDEGGYGSQGVSYSLIEASQGVDYVKPSALAAMTTSGLLAGRPALATPSIGIPQGYEADFGATAGGTTRVSAVWTDGLPVTASVTLTSPTGSTDPITVTSEYGNATTVSADSGTAYSLPLSDQVSFLTYPAGDTLTVGPTEAFGTNLASAAAGATATASSGTAANAINGLPLGYGQGWTSGTGDTTPSLTVTLAAASTLDRVIVDTQSQGSVAGGLRDYTVSADEPGTGWVTVGTEQNQLRNHEALLTFAPLVATALKVSISEIDFGGYFGGGIPPFWPVTWNNTAFIHTVEAYGGSGGPSVVDGTGLPALVAGASGGGGTSTTTTTTTTTTTVPPTTTTTTDPPPTTTTTTPTTVPPTTTTTTDPPPTTTTTTTDPPPTTTTTTDPPPTTTTTTTTDPPPTTTTTTTDPPTTTTTTTDPPPTTTTTTTTRPPGHGGGNGGGRGAGTNPNAGRLKGYWLTTSTGGIFTFGDAPQLGSASGLTLSKPIVDMTSTPDKQGYWMVASDGGIFAFGDAGFYGSTGGLPLNRPVEGMAATPDGGGYWLVASDGGVFAFGDAGYYGSTGALALNKPIVGMAATPDGKGYWLVASDGGVFAFGDAGFYGSTGALTLNKPIVGMAPTNGGGGYWLVASDGGIFAIGDAGFYGSTGSLHLNAPITGIQTTPTSQGYWLVSQDGGIFAFGDASYYGSGTDLKLLSPTVAIS